MHNKTDDSGLETGLQSVPKLIDKLQLYAAIRPATGWNLKVVEGRIKVVLTEEGQSILDKLIAENSVLSPKLSELKEELNG